MIQVQEGRKRVREICAGLNLGGDRIETVSLENSLGRVMAEDLTLTRDYPPFDRAMRDGYALRSIDLDSVPTILNCVGETKAGAIPTLSILSRQAIRIMTGAALPGGADAVVMVEDTMDLGGDQIQFQKSVSAESNIARKGVEKRAGTPLFPAGTRIGPPQLALLALEGKSNCLVYRSPMVSILATGDEVVGVEKKPGPFQIRDSNSYSLHAQCQVEGCRTRLMGIAPDQAPVLREKILAGFESSDMLILSGGVSLGKYDFVKPVLEDLGAVVHFDSLSLRPGKPTVFATLGEKFFFGLPGNPVSTFVTFLLFVRPVLAALQGQRLDSMPWLTATLAEPVVEKQGRTALLPARISQGQQGLTVFPVAWKGSADLFALSAANGFLIVPEHVWELKAGTPVEILLFGDLQSELLPHF